jgi:1-acyl-sn-glycerol-3-phosphate acyltransferase
MGHVLEGAGAARRGLALERLGRIAGTGVSFVVFGLGALGLALFVFPLCHVWPGTRAEKEMRVQRLVQVAYRFFIRFMERLHLHSSEWIGLERLRTPGPHLVVANHPTLIDVVHLISKLPQADCVVGEAWERSFFLGSAARWAGYITNARGAEVVEACAERLRAGRTVVIFPEGTRSPLHGMHPFQRGAAHVALAAGVPLEPVTISCAPRLLMKGQPWWDVPERAGRYRFEVGDPIDPQRCVPSGTSAPLAARRLTARLREHIIERSNRARSR